MIPKIIFQTYENKYEDLPEHYRQTSLSWKRLNPGWLYIYHDKDQRSDYVLRRSPELYDIYKKVSKPLKADIWRYLILSENGGVYADMDSFCITPMNYILSDIPENIDLVSTKTERLNHTNNANFAAVKGSKILKKCCEDIIKEYEVNGKANSRHSIHSSFTDNVANNLEIVSKTMVASHGLSYKNTFDLSKITIDYYGNEMPYLDFLSTMA